MEKDLVTAMSIKMLAVIVSFGHGRIRGELHNKYLDSPYVFFDLVRMIQKMEEVFDAKCFPEAFLSMRSFGLVGHNVKKMKSERNGEMKESNFQNNKSEPGGSKCTFEIAVRFRQNATWQGQIYWAEKNMKQNFRSVLEMLKLMDEAISEADGESNQVEWEDAGG